MTDWAALLDAIEDGLTSSPPVLVDDLPAHPGPVPPALVNRAARILQRMLDLQAVLEREQAEIADQLCALSAARAARTRRRDGAKPVPHFLDSRA
jgi:hypothetical protein